MALVIGIKRALKNKNFQCLFSTILGSVTSCSGLNCVLRSSQMDTLNPHVTLFGDRASKEVITVKGGRKDEP